MENASEMTIINTWFESGTDAEWELNLTTNNPQNFQTSRHDINATNPVFLPCNNPENLISKATLERVEGVFHMTILPLIEVFGVTTNVINCLVFVRQSLKDRINLCLFSLALADICFLLLMFCKKFFSFLGLFDEDLEDYWRNKYLGTVLGPLYATMNISNLLTMIISLERCICVVSPFTAKKFLKTRYMAIMIVSMAVYVLGFYSLLNLKYVTIHVTDHVTNTSRWVSRLSAFYTDNQLVIDILYNHLIRLTIPCMSLLVVMVTTSLTVSRLRLTQAWRQGKVKSESSLDKRETALTKMLTVVCIIYIATITPSVTIGFARTLVPGFMPTGKYCNIFFLIEPIVHVLEVTNSSVNFVVYFTMGTRFRNSVREMFGTGPEKKTTKNLCPLSESVTSRDVIASSADVGMM